MTRGVSTAVDVAVFLLVVSAATLTAATVHPPRHPDGDAADEVALVVATTTATVEYEPGLPAPGNRTPDARSRTAHGTLAGLLADAAFATATVDDRPLTPAGTAFERAVRAAARDRLPDAGVQVVATWRPVPGAPVVGRTAVGPSPPPDADVAAATLAVGVPAGPVTVENRTVRGVAAAVARAVVRGRFPPDATGGVLRSDTGVRTRRRYRHAARVLGADVDGPLRRRNAAAANRRLAAALTPRVTRGLRRRYDDPRAAARAVSAGRVRVTIRRWSP